MRLSKGYKHWQPSNARIPKNRTQEGRRVRYGGERAGWINRASSPTHRQPGATGSVLKSREIRDEAGEVERKNRRTSNVGIGVAKHIGVMLPEAAFLVGVVAPLTSVPTIGTLKTNTGRHAG